MFVQAGLNELIEHISNSRLVQDHNLSELSIQDFKSDLELFT